MFHPILLSLLEPSGLQIVLTLHKFLHDGNTGETIVGRDPIGVRPVFLGRDANGNYGFASEAKALVGLCESDTIKPFAPGHLWKLSTET